MERTPFKAPLKCYGFELDLGTQRCQQCPHQTNCCAAMGKRANRVPLSKAAFNFVPKRYKVNLNLEDVDDPEYVNMNRVYTLCYLSIFNKHSAESTNEYRDQIAQNARELRCSIRLYMLAAMLGYSRHQDEVMGHTDQAYAKAMHPKFLINKRAFDYVQMYGDLCRKRFGGFTLTDLDVLHGGGVAADDVQTRILHSEIIAGKFIVAFHANRGGDVETELFQRYETALDPYWLATEPSYMTVVLEPFLKAKTGTKVQQNHRHNVIKTIGELKRRPSIGHATHLARTMIMPQPIERVLYAYRRTADDFEIETETVTNSFTLWRAIGRALQQLYCLNVYETQADGGCS